MNLHVIQTFEEFIALETEWDMIVSEHYPDYFNYRHKWFRLYWKNFNENKKLSIIIFRDKEGKLVGIVPLCISKKKYKGIIPVKRAEFIADGKSDWNDFLYNPGVEPKDLIEKTFIYILQNQKCDELILHDLPEYSQTVEALKSKKFSYKSILKTQSICYFINTEGNYESYLTEETSKQHVRQDIRRLKRKLESQGIRAEIRMSQFNDPACDLETISSMHRKSQLRKGRISFFTDNRISGFYLDLMKEFREYCQLYYYYFNEIPVSYVFGFRFNHRFYYWNIGFNTDYQQYSPSKLLLNEIIHRSFTDDTAVFNFMKGDTDYKGKWSKQYKTNVQFKLYNNKGLQGLINRFRSL